MALAALAHHPTVAIPERHMLMLRHSLWLVRGRIAMITWNVQRLTGVMGAQVEIVDVKSLTDTEVAELRALVCEHEMVVIPGQSLTAFEQVEFSHKFGPSGETPFIETSPDHPEVIKVLKEASDGKAFNFGGSWHSDFSFQATPPSFTILHALDIPPFGGDTVWSSMTAAYNALSPQQQELYATLGGVHTARDAYSPKMQALHSGLTQMNIVCDESANDFNVHPLITTHPETGKKVLFYNRAYVRDIVGVETAEERQRLMEWLHLHSTDAKFGVRHKWTVGDLLLWDNRSTQHYALNDYSGYRRELDRTTVTGTKPVL